MKTFLKILVLVVVVVAAVGSIFFFSGTRITKNLDVSDITIHDSVYMNDVRNRISSISHSWRDDFDKINNLIYVYYQNGMISQSQEEELQTQLVNKAALRLTTYALTDYFQQSRWESDKVSSISRSANLLLNHKSVTNNKVAQGDTKFKLEKVKSICENYSAARQLSLVYTNNQDAHSKIDRASSLRNDTYLMNERSIAAKLTKAAQTIHDSHWKQIADSITALGYYTEAYKHSAGSLEMFNRTRTKINNIQTLIQAYKEATSYPPKNNLQPMIKNVNDCIYIWNTKINAKKSVYVGYPDNCYIEERIFPNQSEITQLK